MNHPDDLRAEVIAARLREHPKRQEVVIAPAGQFRRGYDSDVLAKSALESTKKRSSSVILEVSRDGLYDFLPEALFHLPHSVKAGKRIEASLEEIRKKQKEENQARTFFLAFESEFSRHRIDLESEEHKGLCCFSDEKLNTAMLTFWALTSISEDQRQIPLLYLLPLSYRFAGKLKLVSKCLSAVLGIKVQLAKSSPIAKEVTNSHIDPPILGDTSLGVDFVLCESVNNGIHSVNVCLGPLQRGEVAEYLPDGNGLRLIEKLFAFFLPADVDINFDVTLESQLEEFVLSDELHTGRLGYTTIL